MGVRIPPPLPSVGRSGDAMDFLRRAQEFVREVIAEFRKVTWPSRQELINSTVVVIAVTVVVALFLGSVDIVLAKIVEAILRCAGMRRCRRARSGSSFTPTRDSRTR